MDSKILNSKFRCLLLGLLGLWAGGCASGPDPKAKNTALDAGNLVEITQKMAQSLAAEPRVQEVIQKEGPLKVVVEPVENHLRAEVLPRGPADAFTARLRVLLSKSAPESFTWIMNRDAFNSLRKKELETPGTHLDLGPSPESIQPRYALYAEFYSLANEDSEHRSSDYLCVYKLTDLQARTILWTDKYELKKVAVKAFLD